MVIENGWVCRVESPNMQPYWLTTRNGNTNRRQIKLYSSSKKALAAANFYALPEGTQVKTFFAELKVIVEEQGQLHV